MSQDDDIDFNLKLKRIEIATGIRRPPDFKEWQKQWGLYWESIGSEDLKWAMN